MDSCKRSTVAEEPSVKKPKTELLGYIHHVSPKKTSSTKKQYFTGVLQEQTSYRTVVIFSQKEHSTYKDLEANRTPVKITNPTLKPSMNTPGLLDILIHSNTSIEVLQDLPFHHDPRKAEDTPQLTLAAIAAHPQNYQKVSITILVQELRLQEEKWIAHQNKAMVTTKYAVADHTSSMHLMTWGETFLTVNKWYTFKNISVRVFNDQVSLTTTPSTEIVQVRRPAKSTAVPPLPDDSSAFLAEVIGAQVFCNKLCPHKHLMKDINPECRTSLCANCNVYYKTSKIETSWQAIVTLAGESGTPEEFTMDHKCLMNTIPPHVFNGSNTTAIVHFLIEMDKVQVRVIGKRLITITSADMSTTDASVQDPSINDDDLLVDETAFDV